MHRQLTIRALLVVAVLAGTRGTVAAQAPQERDGVRRAVLGYAPLKARDRRPEPSPLCLLVYFDSEKVNGCWITCFTRVP